MYRAPPVRRVENTQRTRQERHATAGNSHCRGPAAAASGRTHTRGCVRSRVPRLQFRVSTGSQPSPRLQALRRQVVTGRVSHVFEADIRSYFTRIDHQWLRRMVAHRIADPIILRLISKWLKAGALRDGVFIAAEEGTPQGGPISPVLSNVYLHFTLDLWFEKKFKSQCRGEAYLVRFADDFVGCFQFQEDAQNFQRQLRERFARFNLEWPRTRSGCCSLDVLLPPCGADAG